MLNETVAYLEQRRKADQSFTYEILVVDDGSRDNTTDVALEFAKERQNPYIRVLTLEKNRGKGGAVTQVNIRLSIVHILLVFMCVTDHFSFFVNTGHAVLGRRTLIDGRCRWRNAILGP